MWLVIFVVYVVVLCGFDVCLLYFCLFLNFQGILYFFILLI